MYFRHSGNQAGGNNNKLRAPATGGFLTRMNQGAAIDDVHIVSPSDGTDITALAYPSYIAASAGALLMLTVAIT